MIVSWGILCQVGKLMQIRCIMLISICLCWSIFGVGFPGPASAKGETQPNTKKPELRLSLRDAMKAAVDESPSVQLFQERITQAEDLSLIHI